MNAAGQSARIDAEGMARVDRGDAEEQAFVEATPTMAALLEVAIQDMEARLATGRYESNGSLWHHGEGAIYGTGRCAICLAGATLLRLGIGDGEGVGGLEGDGPVARRLWALEDLRGGDIEAAASIFYGRDTPEWRRARCFEREDPAEAAIADGVRVEKHLDDWSKARAGVRGTGAGAAAGRAVGSPIRGGTVKDEPAGKKIAIGIAIGAALIAPIMVLVGIALNGPWW